MTAKIPKKIISFTLKPETINKIHSLAFALGISDSLFVDRLVKEYLVSPELEDILNKILELQVKAGTLIKMSELK